MPYPINSAHRLLLEDGTSYLLLEDGVSKLIIDENVGLDDPVDAATPASVTPGLTFYGQNITVPLPVLVQSTSNVNNAFTSAITGTFANSLTPGSTILIGWEGDLSTTVANTPTNTGGLTYARLTNYGSTETGVKIEVWSAYNASSNQAAHSVSFTDNGGGVKNTIIMQEWLNMPISSANDQTTAAQDAGTSILASSGATSTLSQAPELVWVFGANGSASNVFAPFPGYGGFIQTVNTSPTNVAVASYITTTTAAVTGQLLLTAANFWCIIVVTFKAVDPAVATAVHYEVQIDTINTFDSQ